MSTVALEAPPAIALRSTLWSLARLETKRYARHPVFLVGLALGLLASAGERGPLELDYQVIPAFFIGVLGFVVAHRLTTSTRRSRSIVDATPVTETVRTAALCLACVVPVAAGLVLVLLHRAFVLADPIPDWQYGTYGTVDRFVITMVLPVIACAGGPLLGVCVGRWWRFPASGLLAVVVLVMWSNLSSYLPAQGMESSSLPARIIHMATPYTAFGTGDGEGDTLSAVISYTGSPVWFALWALALCGLAAAAAVWPGAVAMTRGRVRRSLVALACLALVALTLSVTGGNHRLYDTSPGGTITHAESDGG